MNHKKLLLSVLAICSLVLVVNLFNSVKGNKLEDAFNSNSFKNMKEKFLLKNYRNNKQSNRNLNRVSDAWVKASKDLKGKKFVSKKRLKRVDAVKKVTPPKKVANSKDKKKKAKKVDKKKIPGSKEFGNQADFVEKKDVGHDDTDTQGRGDINYGVGGVLDKIDDEIVGRSANEWLSKILKSRNYKTVREFIEAFEVGLVLVNDFYAVTDELLSNPSAEINKLGISALSAIINPRSFRSLAEYKYVKLNGENQKEINSALEKYGALANLRVLKAIVSVPSSPYALIEATHLVEKVGKTINPSTANGSTGSLGNNQNSSGQASGNLALLQEILLVIGNLSQTHQDSDVRRQADATLDSLREYQTI